ncbi:hypothetical protein EDC14_103157 [Hydrogenispora ethanolica]|uniref:Uncharacterized protein n=1 Tax=Hydrogenispora ethanolica TaxID=1082276 RepID=A0A4R1R8A1_HYDET|nr:hypothetical protein EDC14_103157 [Hydrogenispora ethanolica]
MHRQTLRKLPRGFGQEDRALGKLPQPSSLPAPEVRKAIPPGIPLGRGLPERTVPRYSFTRRPSARSNGSGRRKRRAATTLANLPVLTKIPS